MKKGMVLCFAVAALSTSFACSNVFVSGKGVAAVGRTMDLELNTGNTMGYGARGMQNTSNINAPQAAPVNAVKWTNHYAFLGQTAFHTYVILDGINSAGVYASYLDLPDVSYYPNYNPDNKKPELGLTDIVNYVLGTSATVKQAIQNIEKTQPVINTFEMQYKDHFFFGGNAVHLALRDRFGNTGVIEWTKLHGKSIMNVYYHPAGTNYVRKIVPGYPALDEIIKGTQGAVLTNSPAYDWQLKNAANYNYMFTGSTKRQWNGTYQNGSGMAGLPGDYTPVSRFVRGTQLIRLLPKVETEKQALMLVYTVLETLKVPVGSNPAASIWASVSDLKNSVYYFKPLLYVSPGLKQHLVKVALPPLNNPWQAYPVKKYALKNVVPQGWLSAEVKPGKMATEKQLQFALTMGYAPTPGGIKSQVILD